MSMVTDVPKPTNPKHSPQIDDDGLLRSLDGYIGSVGSLGAGAFAASAPRGGQVIIVDTDGIARRALTSQDVCGVASTRADETLVTDGLGRVYALGKTKVARLHTHKLVFDNHLISV